MTTKHNHRLSDAKAKASAARVRPSCTDCGRIVDVDDAVICDECASRMLAMMDYSMRPGVVVELKARARVNQSGCCCENAPAGMTVEFSIV